MLNSLEKFNKFISEKVEGLFGASADVRPKDILRKVFAVMEENRHTGFDGRVNVPNRYIFEISSTDEDEKNFLLSFLDHHELEAAIQNYCAQHNYVIRGELDFTINELDPTEQVVEKVSVKALYSAPVAAPGSPAPLRTGDQIGLGSVILRIELP